MLNGVKIVGMGYVGEPLYHLVSKHYPDVEGADINPDRARTPLTTIPKIVVICVPTPLTASRKPDHSFVEAAVAEHVVHQDQLVILESTVAPGTTDRLLASRVKEYAFSPERINPGDPDFEVGNIPKVVGGASAARDFYESLGIKVHYVPEPKVAELSKLVENTYRLVNIALAHELKHLARMHGCYDYNSVLDAAATKPFGFMAFRPSVGVGGHCIPVDPVFLLEDPGYHTPLISEALDAVRDVPGQLVDSLLGAFPDAFSFLLVGASYKPNVADTRESPTFAVQRVLESQGVKVCIWDDVCRLYPSPGARFDVAVRMQAHSCEQTDLISKVSRIIVDGANYV